MDQHPIDAGIHLREVGRPERHPHVVFRDGVREFTRRVGIQRADGVGAFRLEPDRYAVRPPERAQPRFVGRRQRLEMTKDENRLARSGILAFADGDFDLRHAARDRQTLDQRSHRSEHRGDFDGEHVALAHVGDVAAALLVEPDERATLLLHDPHRQARAIPVVPGRSVDRRQHAVGAHASDVEQVVLEHALLDRDLCGDVEMLHRAATADAEVRAPRNHARGRRREQIDDVADRVARLAASDRIRDALTGERTVDEDDLAVRVTDAAALVIERLDHDRLDDDRGFLAHRRPAPVARQAAAMRVQASRYSRQCGAVCVDSNARAIASSASKAVGSSTPRIIWKRQYTSHVFITSVSQ